LLLIDQYALSTRDLLSELGMSTIVLNDYSKGLLAAERFFAELWEGKSGQFGAMAMSVAGRAAAAGANQ